MTSQIPAWLQRAGDRLTADPQYDQLDDNTATVATIRACAEEAAAEYPGDQDASAAVTPTLAAMLTSQALAEHTAPLRAVLAEILPPYIAAARTRATPPA